MRIRLLCLLALPAALTIAAGPPKVTKVEPPNWWTGHSVNPVRVLLRGENLCGARVEARHVVERVRASATCTYLFADVAIQEPGEHPLKIITEQGETVAPFRVLEPLARKGRFQGFSPDDVMYLIMPDRFANGDTSNDGPAEMLARTKPRYYHGGDLQGVISRVEYLKDLGVSAIWLNPVYDNSNQMSEGRGDPFSDYHGYGAVDLYAVDEHLGDVKKLRELVDAAHEHGIKVIQDQVANHTGPMHPWVSDPPTPTWFNGTRKMHAANTWQTWTLMDPNAREELRRTTLEGWFLDILPDLNQDDEDGKRYLIQNSLWWIGMTGIDGIRQDTVPYVHRKFWSEWTSALKREYPHVRVVGEVLESNPALVSFFQGGRARFDQIDSGIDTLFDFPLCFALRRAFGEGKPLVEVAAMLAQDWLYADPSVLVTLLGLHDVPRFMGVTGATPEGLKLAFTFLMTTRGTPLIYYGDEIGMRGGSDPDNRRDFPGGWKGDARNAFEAGGRSPEENAVLSHVRTLTQLRREVQALRTGRLLQLFAVGQQYAYARVLGASAALVVLNNDAAPTTVEFSVNELSDGDYADRTGGTAVLHVRSGRARVGLSGRCGAVFVN